MSHTNLEKPSSCQSIQCEMVVLTKYPIIDFVWLFLLFLLFCFFLYSFRNSRCSVAFGFCRNFLVVALEWRATQCTAHSNDRSRHRRSNNGFDVEGQGDDNNNDYDNDDDDDRETIDDAVKLNQTHAQPSNYLLIERKPKKCFVIGTLLST